VKVIDAECRTAQRGCVDCKKQFAENLNKALEPFRARRAELAAQPERVKSILDDGADRARVIAEKTMKEVRKAVQLP
jgi:tryptophanyl-tRNA synthetase